MTPVLRESFTPKQVEVIEYDLENKPRHTILHGAIRSAKTTTNILLFISHVASFRNQKKKFIITGSSISAIKRNVLDDMSRLLPIDTHLSQKNEFTLLGNTIICFGADQSDSYKYMKGFTAYGWLGNEVTDHHPNSIDQALKRCSGKGARIFWDTNPSDPDHFIKTNFIDRSDSLLENGKIDIKSWHFTLDDNTKLDPEYIESIKRSTPEGVLYDRDILGIWVAGSGQIGAFQSVTEWKCQYSVGFVDPSFSDRVGSDSTAVAVVGVQDDLLVFTGMLFPKSIADPETRKELLDFLNVYTPIETVFESQLSDSSIFFLDVMKRDELIYDIKNLWTVKHQSRGKHERIMATVAVQKQNMRILEGTQQAFSLEVSRYRKDAPHDDACLVGETKIITITGNKKIKDIKKGDRVLTPFGFKKVLKSGFTGEKEIIEVVGLRITHNHKVYNKLLNHFTVANSLTGKNECDILSIKGIIKWKILLYLTGKNIQNRETIISLAKQQTRGGGIVNSCIRQYGNFIIKKKFLKVIMFTIKILILIIMILLISNYLQFMNIYQCMVKRLTRIQNIKQRIKSSLIASEIKQKNGMQAQKVTNGIKNMLKTLFLKHGSLEKKESAFIAEKNIYQKLKDRQNIALINAVMQTDQKEIIKEKVYNLTVEGGSYYANNILVSNCDSLAGAIEALGTSEIVSEYSKAVSIMRLR